MKVATDKQYATYRRINEVTVVFSPETVGQEEVARLPDAERREAVNPEVGIKGPSECRRGRPDQ